VADLFSEEWKAAIIFLAVYVGLVVSKRHRPHIAWAGVIAAFIFRVLHPLDLFNHPSAVNWNVIGIFVGSLILAELLIYSKVPEMVSDILINKSPNLGVAFLAVVAFASFLSIFIENVVTVLIVAPIALVLCQKTKVSPVPVIIGLAISSNLQGVAILIGDTPSMLLAKEMPLTFLDFFFYQGKPSIFWFTQLGALAGFGVLYLVFRRYRQRPQPIEVSKVTSWVPVWLIAATIVLLSVGSYIDPQLIWFGGAVCMVIGIAGYIWYGRRNGDTRVALMRRLDVGTALFLVAVFMLVHMLVETGVIAALVGSLEAMLGGASPFVIYTAVVWFSVLISAFIDNIPYIAAMLPVVLGTSETPGLSETLGVPRELLAFGVLLGSCLGGNITPIGAASNLVAFRILGREGQPISFGTFVKIGLPFTLAATGAAYAALYLLYK
jgi:Na+/H+ antiporter NhaD/arsenite permease-like protein